ncbi:amidohydrolase [Pseudomonas veronii]|uniref:Amidohydrolase n=1 Tax=Pseudomonas veronii TaxID=76761 RepID=A0A7Y0ZVY0_PSEVE|nr:MULTISPECIES: M20 aminoacylase family protein [Pseudomonas]SEB33520.1 hippurate hydrolase [Pseudomonas marginalis]AQY68550.1 amidohydrolase [Pseudomonas veronii]KRP75847.1 amidohydrolase [Pseudomonas veronii]MDY7549470.1 M20 aminoacylase family protein [Pseudomonas sp. FG1]MEB0052087.1 M20 aminoacylase family protein [Pseudomonas sp. FG1]
MKTEPHYCKVDDLRPQTEELTRIRRHIHQHPEMAYEEFQTAKLVAERLRAWGFSVTEGVGETGVVGSLTVGAGKNIGIRADMDALPLTEQTGLPYASVHQGKMHACGHDGHTTMLLGAAEYLARTRNFRGTVHLYFQPAEEKGFDSGAQRMVNDGLFERFPCDAVFGMHNHPGEAPGTFLFRSGPFMSASDKVAITIHGLGGHAARPHLTVDPVVVASSIVMSLQTIVARNINPVEPAVVTVGLLQAGVANNVISSSAYLELSIRSFSKRVRSQLKERIEALVHAQANSYGATATIDYMEGYPVIDNDRAQTEFALQVARELVGDEHVIAHADQLMSSEDFAYMLEQRPGCFLRLGNGVGEDGCMVHNPAYDFNDKNLPIGAAYWARLVERYLN